MQIVKTLVFCVMLGAAAGVPVYGQEQPVGDRQYLVIPVPQDPSAIRELRGSTAEALIFAGDPNTWILPEPAQLGDLGSPGPEYGGVAGAAASAWNIIVKLAEILTGISSIATAVETVSGSLESEEADDEIEIIKGRLADVETRLRENRQLLLNIDEKIDDLRP